jgi:hypothetical protein
MAMDFVEQIRSQRKFKSPHDLAEQIAKDCNVAKNILAAETTKGCMAKNKFEVNGNV